MLVGQVVLVDVRALDVGIHALAAVVPGVEEDRAGGEAVGQGDAAPGDAVPELVGGHQVAQALDGDGGVEDAEAAAQHRPVAAAEPVGEADARADVVLVGLDEAVAETQLIRSLDAIERDHRGRQQRCDLGVRHDPVAAAGQEDEVRELLVLLVPDPHDLVAKAQVEGQVAARLPVVLDVGGEVIGVAVQRAAVGHLVLGLTRHAEEEIAERVAGHGGVELIAAAEVDAGAEPVARDVAIEERARLERVAAHDPGDVVRDGERVLDHRAVHAAAGVGDVRRAVRARGELDRGEPAPVGGHARRQLEAELARDLGIDEGALPRVLVEVVADAELVHQRAREDLGPAGDPGRGVELPVQDREVRERSRAVAAGLEGNGVGVVVLVAATQEDRVVLARLVVQAEIGAMAVPGLGQELLEDAVSVCQVAAIRQRVEEVHDGRRLRADAAGRDHLVGEGLAGQRIARVDRGAAEVAAAHSRGGHGGPSAPEDRLVVGAFVVGVEERLARLERAAQTGPETALMRVRVGVTAQPGQIRVAPAQLLVVGEGVEAVRVEVVEGGPAVAVAAALGGDEDAGQATVLRAVGV